MCVRFACSDTDMQYVSLSACVHVCSATSMTSAVLYEVHLCVCVSKSMLILTCVKVCALSFFLHVCLFMCRHA